MIIITIISNYMNTFCAVNCSRHLIIKSTLEHNLSRERRLLQNCHICLRCVSIALHNYVCDRFKYPTTLFVTLMKRVKTLTLPSLTLIIILQSLNLLFIYPWSIFLYPAVGLPRLLTAFYVYLVHNMDRRD